MIVKLNQFPPDKEAYIILLLHESKKPMYGLEIVKASNGEICKGTVYATLQRMCRKRILVSKHITSTAKSGPMVKIYSLTKKGVRLAEILKLIAKL